MEPNIANSGASIYFICAVIKLLVRSSQKCIEIFFYNTKLQSLIPSDKNDIIIQD